MKIAFINGSPKKRKSASEKIINELIKRLPEAQECVLCNPETQEAEEIISAIAGSGALVFVFPLYVDALPARLVKFLDESDKLKIAGRIPGAGVYAVVNSGFYEARQNTTALSIMKNFCAHTGLDFLRGAAVGRWPLKGLARALDTLADNIKNRESGEDLFVAPGFPRFLYNLQGNQMWKKAAKKRGLTTKDLYSSAK